MHTTEAILAAKKTRATEMIRENLTESDKWVFRAIEVIYDRQTMDEQMQLTTKETNGIGFTGVDASFLSSLAMQIRNFDASKYRSPLSPKQLAAGRKAIKKYAGQILVEMQAKNPAPAPAPVQGVQQLLDSIG